MLFNESKKRSLVRVFHVDIVTMHLRRKDVGIKFDIASYEVRMANKNQVCNNACVYVT